MTLDELCRLERGFRLPEFLFFWGHTPDGSGGVGPWCLSQWWPSPFSVDGQLYPTAEHFMMAEKARLFDDESAARRILASAEPRRAKDFGRQVRGFREEPWEERRYDIVVRGNLAKFGQAPALREYLCGTAGRVLVEASPFDAVWGNGLAVTDARAAKPSAWRGTNLLGFALMDVRATLCGD